MPVLLSSGAQLSFVPGASLRSSLCLFLLRNGRLALLALALIVHSSADQDEWVH